MAGDLGRLNILLGLNSAEFTAGLTKSEQQAKNFAQKFSNNLKSLQATAKTAAISLAGIGLAATGVGVAWAKSTAQAGKEISRLSTLTGTSVEEFQKLAYGAKSVGIEQEKLADIFKDTQDKIGDFVETGGGALKDFFENIAPKVGVTIDQFRNLSGSDALGLYYSSLEKANLSQSQMTFYMEAIASDSTLLAPLLRDNGRGFREMGDEADRLGVIMKGDTVKAAQELDRNIAKLESITKSYSTSLSNQVLPVLNEFIGELGKAATKTDSVHTAATTLANDESLKNWAHEAILLFADLADSAVTVASAIKAAVSGVIYLGAQVPATLSGMDSIANNLLGMRSIIDPDGYKKSEQERLSMQARADRVAEEFKQAFNNVKNPSTFFADVAKTAISNYKLNSIAKEMGGMGGAYLLPEIVVTGDGSGSGTKNKTNSGGSTRDLAADYSKQLTEQIALLGKVTEYEQALTNIQLGKYGSLTEMQKNDILGKAQTLDLLKQTQEETEKYQAFIDEITGKNDLDAYNEKLGWLKRAWEEGAISVEKYKELVDQVSAEHKEKFGEMSEFAKEASAQIQGQFGQTLEDLLSGNFDNIGKNWDSLLRKMVAQAIATNLNQALFGQGIGSGGGLLGGLVSGLFGGISNVGAVSASPVIAGVGNLGGAYGFGSLALAEGGSVFGPGTTTSDSIPALLSNREYVVRASVADKPGVRSFLDSLNNGGVPVRRASGGSVGNVPAIPNNFSAASNASNIQINITNNTSSKISAQETTDGSGKSIIEIVVEEAENRIAGKISQAQGGVYKAIGSSFGLRPVGV